MVGERETLHSATLWGPGNTALLGPEMRLETEPDMMEMVENSPSDRRQVERRKDPRRSSVTNGSKPVTGNRSAPLRRISVVRSCSAAKRHRQTCPYLNRRAGAARSEAGEGRSYRVIECQLFSAGNAEAEPSTDEQDTDHLGQPAGDHEQTQSRRCRELKDRWPFVSFAPPTCI
jgi:ribosomal protein L44E